MHQAEKHIKILLLKITDRGLEMSSNTNSHKPQDDFFREQLYKKYKIQSSSQQSELDLFARKKL